MLLHWVQWADWCCGADQRQIAESRSAQQKMWIARARWTVPLRCTSTPKTKMKSFRSCNSATRCVFDFVLVSSVVPCRMSEATGCWLGILSSETMSAYHLRGSIQSENSGIHEPFLYRIVLARARACACACAWEVEDFEVVGRIVLTRACHSVCMRMCVRGRLRISRLWGESCKGLMQG